MTLTPRARHKLTEFLSANKSKVPGVVWACDEKYSDPIKDGYWQFGFYDRVQVEQRDGKRFLVDIDDVEFVVDIPETLRSQFSELYLDFVNSRFVAGSNAGDTGSECGSE